MQDFFKQMFLAALQTEGGVEKLYLELTEEYRPFIDSVPKFAKVVGKDASTLTTAILKLVNEVASDENVKAESKKWKTRQIKRRMEILQEYVDTGFTREEAFELLKLDVVNAKALAAGRSTSIKF